jgi:hypothetical protein
MFEYDVKQQIAATSDPESKEWIPCRGILMISHTQF